MFKKFTDTLSGTLDTVKSYGSSMVIGQIGQGKSFIIFLEFFFSFALNFNMKIFLLYRLPFLYTILATVMSLTDLVGGATGADGTENRAPTTKLSLNLPTLGNGSISAPATTTNSPDRGNAKPSLASNTLQGIQNTLGKLTGKFLVRPCKQCLLGVLAVLDNFFSILCLLVYWSQNMNSTVSLLKTSKKY